ncbi:hypothetical protein EVAR_61749_1 [Eumeta japonica]|uniref:Uncharacterized protein n=1 Tax=Eumeta variegata TaxID=151549 RepID=A0A4C1YLG3_EUMVA|nr:hypothetical protein EVAR_61749_1 [Eumeta japonica]
MVGQCGEEREVAPTPATAALVAEEDDSESGAGVAMAALEAEREQRKRRERRDSGCAHERKQRAHSEERLPAQTHPPLHDHNRLELFYYLPSYRVHRVHAVTPGAARGAGQRASAPLNSFCSCRNRAARPRDLKMVAIHGVERRAERLARARRPQYGKRRRAATRSARADDLRERPRTDEPAPAASAPPPAVPVPALSLNAVRDAYTRNTRDHTPSRGIFPSLLTRSSISISCSPTFPLGYLTPPQPVLIAIIQYETLPLSKTINSHFNCQQVMRLKHEVKKKRSELVNRKVQRVETCRCRAGRRSVRNACSDVQINTTCGIGASAFELAFESAAAQPRRWDGRTAENARAADTLRRAVR